MDDELESVRDWSSLSSEILYILLNRLNDSTIWNNDNKLGLFKAGTHEWVNTQTACGNNVCDIIAYQGLFYATDLNGSLISVDPLTNEVKEIIIISHSEAQVSDELFTYLVESSGRLYLVNKIVNNRVVEEIKVFMLGYSYSANGECNHIWEPLTAQQLGWGQGNCIMFTEEGFEGSGYYEYEGFEYNDDDFNLICLADNVESLF